MQVFESQLRRNNPDILLCVLQFVFRIYFSIVRKKITLTKYEHKIDT